MHLHINPSPALSLYVFEQYNVVATKLFAFLPNNKIYVRTPPDNESTVKTITRFSRYVTYCFPIRLRRGFVFRFAERVNITIIILCPVDGMLNVIISFISMWFWFFFDFFVSILLLLSYDVRYNKLLRSAKLLIEWNIKSCDRRDGRTTTTIIIIIVRLLLLFPEPTQYARDAQTPVASLRPGCSIPCV